MTAPIALPSLSDSPLLSGGYYDNPWPSWSFPAMNFSKVCKFARFMTSQPSRPSQADLERELPMFVPSALSTPGPVDGEGVEVTWIGHASCLVRIGGYTILTDPVFGNYCSPVPMPKLRRLRPPAVSLADLPPIHAVVFSHDHYDHMDLASAKIIEQRFKPHWFVPTGNEKHFSDCKIAPERMHPLGWWESHVVSDFQANTPGGLRFTLVPAQHWSKRALSGRCSVLWGGWVVETVSRRSSFYFAGDTGFTRGTPVHENWHEHAVDPTSPAGLADKECGSLFSAIGERLGPFDVALIPVGAYCPRELLCAQHIDPTEAVAVHQRVKAKFSVGIHWGTFILSQEGITEPPIATAAAAAKAGLAPSEFVTPPHGLTAIYSRSAAEPLIRTVDDQKWRPHWMPVDDVVGTVLVSGDV